MGTAYHIYLEVFSLAETKEWGSKQWVDNAFFFSNHEGSRFIKMKDHVMIVEIYQPSEHISN